ncbi:MAG: WS/DGAT domain-containing protein [Gammaproteobacteria bacterium]|nr:WS/DGAT domain-containing protein [Gammaproteobacteria bacterium]
MRLSDHDAAFLYGETASGPMHGANIAVVEGELSLETVRSHVACRLHLVPRLRQRLVFAPFNLAHPKWVDDPSFDIAQHVKGHSLDTGATLDEALAAAAKLAEPLLPRDRPLWLTYVIEGVKDRTVLIQMGHHAMADGASGVDISLALFELQAKAPDPAPQPWSPAPLPSAAELAAEALREQVESVLDGNPFAAMQVGDGRMEMLRRAGESVTRFLAEPVLTAPWNAGLVGPKRELAWRRYGFGEFREIRRRFGGTINDVVLSVAAEGAARYLADDRRKAAGSNLRIMCPVNVRQENEQGALGNRVSGIFPMFPAAPMNVVERLRKVRHEMEQIKQNREAQALQELMEAMPSPPPLAMASAQLVGGPLDPTALAARVPPPPLPWGTSMPMTGFNFTCTNVPGVQVPQYIAGHPVLDVLGMLMLGGVLGYGLAVTSYNRQLCFTLVCDPRLMPDVERMADSVDGAFGELLAAARGEDARKPGAAAQQTPTRTTEDTQ